MQAPAFITVLKGPRHVFDLVNAPYTQLVGQRAILGKPVRDAFPELEGQGFFELLDEVYRSGKAFIGKDMRLCLQAEAGAPVEERFVDFVYQPLVEADGSVSGIFAHGVELTERRRAEQALEAHVREIGTLNHRLTRAMKETHHRVKNNLQVISAMIEMQVYEHKEEQAIPLKEFVRLRTPCAYPRGGAWPSDAKDQRRRRCPASSDQSRPGGSASYATANGVGNRPSAIR